MTAAPSLSVVFPAFDEAERIGTTLDSVVAWVADRETPQVLVVDDGSRDDTAAIVACRALPWLRLIRLPENRGKGAALRAGVRETTGDVVLLSDVDLSTPLREVDRLVPMLDEADLLVGSRDLPDSNVVRSQPARRRFAGRLFNLAVRACGIRGILDTQCGFKLMRGPVGRELFARTTVDRFAYDVELLWLAQRAGYRVEEVGVEWRDDPSSRVRLLRDGSRMLFDVLRFRARHENRPGAARGAPER